MEVVWVVLEWVEVVWVVLEWVEVVWEVLEWEVVVWVALEWVVAAEGKILLWIKINTYCINLQTQTFSLFLFSKPSTSFSSSCIVQNI